MLQWYQCLLGNICVNIYLIHRHRVNKPIISIYMIYITVSVFYKAVRILLFTFGKFHLLLIIFVLILINDLHVYLPANIRTISN